MSIVIGRGRTAQRGRNVSISDITFLISFYDNASTPPFRKLKVDNKTSTVRYPTKCSDQFICQIMKPGVSLRIHRTKRTFDDTDAIL